MRWQRGGVAAFLLIAAIALTGVLGWKKFGTPSERRDDLWRVVHVVCASDQRVLKRPSPCIEVDRTNGFAVVPGGLRSDEILLVPTRRIVGIEDPTLLDPDTPNYWAFAWNARHYLLKGVRTIPDDWVGLAVNSAFARTQDQLHIHIDCVKPAVREALNARPPGPGRWSSFAPEPGHSYEATRISAAQLHAVSPFRMIADAIGQDPGALAQQTVVLVGAPPSSDGPALYLLRQAYHSEARATGHGEELLDHSCAGPRGRNVAAQHQGGAQATTGR